jgi:membrane-associated phospholipid phosphatase
MSRGIWIGEAIQSAVPNLLVVLSGLLTLLGDPFTLAVLLVAVYWLRESDEQISVVGLALAGLALIVTLKYTFALPRPTWTPVVETVPWGLEWLLESERAADGHGFPSGHAMGSTIAYTLLAITLDVGRRRHRYALAAAVIVVVSLSRVLLGVHYLVDVVAGIALGLVFVVGGRRLLASVETDSGTVALGLAVALCALSVAVSEASRDGLLLLGSALGAFGSWQLVLLDRRYRIGPQATVGTLPLANSYRGWLAVLGLVPLLGALAVGPRSPYAALGALMGIGFGIAVVIPAALRSLAGGSPREIGGYWRERLLTEGRVLHMKLRRHELVFFDRSVLRLTALLYVLPGLIAVESFSEPVQLPSLFINLLAVPFRLFVSGPISVVKWVLYEPLDVEWLFDIPVVGEILVLSTLFVVYLCIAAAIHNGSTFLSALSARSARPGRMRGVPPDEHTGGTEPQADPTTTDDSTPLSDGGPK